MVKLNGRLLAVLFSAALILGAAESPGCSGSSCLEDAALLQVKSLYEKTLDGLMGGLAQDAEPAHSVLWDDEIVPKDPLVPEDDGMATGRAGLTSKCCLCGNDEVVYSRTGSCKKCNGGTVKTTNATETCQMLSPEFIDDSARCTASCRDSLTSRCCLCGDNEVVYSRTGLCKKCTDGTKKTSNATEKCQRFSPEFVDDSPTCTAHCRDSFASRCCLCGNDEVVYSRTGSCKKCSGGTQKTLDATKTCQMLSPKFIDDSATCTAGCRESFASKCCLCSDGEVVYSRSGSCKNCKGKPDKTKAATNKCQVLSKKFSGDSATCTASCKDSFASKCCLCGNGEVVYSRSGSCKNCKGKPDKSYKASSRCQALSKKFSGDSAKCTSSCRSLVASKKR